MGNSMGKWAINLLLSTLIDSAKQLGAFLVKTWGVWVNQLAAVWLLLSLVPVTDQGFTSLYWYNYGNTILHKIHMLLHKF